MRALFTLGTLVLLSSLLGACFADETTLVYDLIYKSYPDAVPCTRWLNTTHQVGCGTPQEGVMGHLVYLADLAAMKRLAGLLLLDITAPPATGFSPQDQFPQQNLSVSTGFYAWNPTGSGMMLRDYPFPLYLLNSTDSVGIIEKAQANANGSNASIGRWAAHITSFMWATTNAETCLRRKFCEPVGGQSVWSVLPASAGLKSPKETAQIVVSASSMDSASLFIQRSTGADSDMSGLIANMVALQTIANANIPAANFTRKILFAFLDAEAWGYGGSQRFIADIANFTCQQWYNESMTSCNRPFYPTVTFQQLDLTKIDTIFEMKQVGLSRSASSELFVHQQSHDFTTAAVSAILTAAGRVQGLSVSQASPNTTGLPPSSSHSFIKYSSDFQSKIAVITDHAGPYTNKYYQSQYDDYRNVKVEHICNAAQLLVETLLLRALDPASLPSLKVNCSSVELLLECFTKDVWKCAELGINGTAFAPDVLRLSDRTPYHYATVFSPYMRQLTPKLVHDFVFYENAQNKSQNISCTSDADCQGPIAACIAERCYESWTFYHNALTTSIDKNYDTDTWVIKDLSAPNWVEPVWSVPQLRIYQTGNPTAEITFLVVAIVEFLLAIAVIVMCKRNYAINFKTL